MTENSGHDKKLKQIFLFVPVNKHLCRYWILIIINGPSEELQTQRLQMGMKKKATSSTW